MAHLRAAEPGPQPADRTVLPQIIESPQSAGRVVPIAAEQPQVAGRVDPGAGRIARSRQIGGRGGAQRAVDPRGIDRVCATDPGPQTSARTEYPQIAEGPQSPGGVVAKATEQPQGAGRVGP